MASSDLFGGACPLVSCDTAQKLLSPSSYFNLEIQVSKVLQSHIIIALSILESVFLEHIPDLLGQLHHELSVGIHFVLNISGITVRLENQVS